jgi:hypothetical protein
MMTFVSKQQVKLLQGISCVLFPKKQADAFFKRCSNCVANCTHEIELLYDLDEWQKPKKRVLCVVVRIATDDGQGKSE